MTMEITCQRCHQTVQDGNTFCPSCGLPQLVYSAETTEGQGQPERWTEAVRDASMVDWKPAIRAAVVFAVPAGLLSSGLSPLSFFGFFWMAAAAAWAVIVYVRGQQPAWITMGAGARIGLVTGIMAVWLAFSLNGGQLFVERYMLHHAGQIDTQWATLVTMSQQMTAQWSTTLSSADAAQAQALRKQMQDFMLSPWGHAGFEVFGFLFYSVLFLFFAIGGGAVGARLLARSRRPQV